MIVPALMLSVLAAVLLLQPLQSLEIGETQLLLVLAVSIPLVLNDTLLTLADASALTFRRDSNASTGERQVCSAAEHVDNAINIIYHHLLPPYHQCLQATLKSSWYLAEMANQIRSA